MFFLPAVLLLSPASVELSMGMMEAGPTCASTLALYCKCIILLCKNSSELSALSTDWKQDPNHIGGKQGKTHVDLDGWDWSQRTAAGRQSPNGKASTLSFGLLWILPFDFPLRLTVPSTHAGPWTPSWMPCSPCLRRGSTAAWSAPPHLPHKVLKDTSAALPGWSCTHLGFTDKQASSSLIPKKPTGITEEGFLKISSALVLATSCQKLSV